jgi:hypothetical protein
VSGLIVVARKSSFQSRAWPLKVRIDGQLVGKVKNGASEQFLVSAGSHIVQTGSGAGSSKKLMVDVADGGYHVLRTGPSKAGTATIVPSVVLGGLAGRAAGRDGSPVPLLALLAVLLVVTLVSVRIPGFFMTLAPVPQPNGLPDLGDPTGRDPVWWTTPGQ